MGQCLPGSAQLCGLSLVLFRRKICKVVACKGFISWLFAGTFPGLDLVVVFQDRRGDLCGAVLIFECPLTAFLKSKLLNGWNTCCPQGRICYVLVVVSVCVR